jgi:hypothetical protein
MYSIRPEIPGMLSGPRAVFRSPLHHDISRSYFSPVFEFLLRSFITIMTIPITAMMPSQITVILFTDATSPCDERITRVRFVRPERFLGGNRKDDR